LVSETSQLKLFLKRITSGSGTFHYQVTVTLGVNILLSAIGLITGPLAAHLLGPAGRGDLAAIQTWPTFFTALALCGIPEAVVYFSARFPRKAGQYMTAAVILTLLIAVPVIIVAYFLLPILLAAQSANVIHMARFYLVYVILEILLLIQINTLYGRGDFFVWNALRGIPSILWFVLLLVGFFIGQVSPGWLATTYLVALSILVIPWHLVIKRRLDPPLWPPEITQWKPFLQYGLPLVTAGVPLRLNLNMDQMLMAGLFSSETLGFYIIAVAWSGALTPIVQSIGKVLFPKTASEKSLTQQGIFLSRGVRLAFTLSIFCSIPIFFLTPLAIRLLFGADFSPAIPAAYILVGASIFLNLKTVLQEGARGIGAPYLVLWSECVGLIFTAILLLALLRPFGIIGAAVASLVAYFITSVFLSWQLSKKINVTLYRMLCPQKEDFESILNVLMISKLTKK
jgi:O-antigen/teichoic acid export membrane protein